MNAPSTTTASVADRCERYRARLDAHLATLASDRERRRFCDREFAKWEERYGQFIANSAMECALADPKDGPTAFDYAITLADISTRQIKYGAA